MFEYIKLNNLRDQAIADNIVSACAVYCDTSPTSRIKITPNHLAYQEDLGAGFVDVGSEPYFTELTQQEQDCVVESLHTLLDPFYNIYYPLWQVMCIHPDDILQTLNTVEATEFYIDRHPQKTNVQLYRKSGI